MTIETVVNQFIEMKQNSPGNANELLDFVQRSYINGDLAFNQYRELFRELSARGARKPQNFIVNSFAKTEINGTLNF